MNKSIPFIIFLLSIINLSFSQSKPGIVKGRIVSEKKQALPGINVTLSGTSLGSTADDEGKFTIDHVPAGEYILIATGIGFSSEKKNVIVKEGQVTFLDLQLNEETKVLSEVIVGDSRSVYYQKTSSSGTRLPLALLETPQSIQVITNAVIQDQQARNLNDVTKNMVGVINNNNYSSFTMRGFSSIESTSSNNFITYDGMLGNVYYWQQLIPLYNIDRVENISGPAAALFSVGTPGGVMNMVTKKPLDQAQYSFNATTGSWGLVDVSTDLTGPLTKNKKLLYRLNVGYNHQNSYRQYQYTQNLFIAPSLTYRFNEKTSIGLDYVNTNYKTLAFEDYGGLLFSNKDGSFNFNSADRYYTALAYSPVDFATARNNALTLSLRHQFSENFKLTYYSRYTHAYLSTGEHNGTYFSPSDTLTGFYDSLQRQYVTWKDRSYNVMNQLFTTETFGTENFKNTLVTGIDYQVYGSKDYYVQGTANSISWTNPDYSKDAFSNYPVSQAFVENNKQETRQFGAYVQDLISIQKKIKILLAGRYESFFWISRPNGKDNYTQDNDSSKAHVFLPRLGTVYSFNANHSVYGSYSQSFNPQYDNSRNTGGPFPPQKGRQYEVGYKAQYFDGQLMSTIALYSIDWYNILGPDPTDPTHQRQIAIPGITSQGAEFTLSGNLRPFFVIGSYAYNNVIFAANSPLGNKGDRYDNAPHSIANVWVKYPFPSNSAFAGLSISVGGKYVSDRIGSTLYTPKFLMPAYSLFDAAVNYTKGKFNFALNGFNLMDSKYIPGWYASQNMVMVGQPRNWRFTVRYRIN